MLCYVSDALTTRDTGPFLIHTHICMLRRGFCLAARPTTLSAIVRAQSKADPTALALLAPQQDVAWDYGTLEERSLRLASLGAVGGSAV